VRPLKYRSLATPFTKTISSWEVVFLGLTFVVLIAALVKPSYYPRSDSALFEYFGKAMLHGQKLYIDEWDTKLPSIYLINELWQKVFGENYRLHSMAETIVSAFTAVPLFALILRKVGVQKWALATLCFAVTYALVPGTMNTTENYATPLILGSILAICSGSNALAGLCAALAVTFWIPSCLVLVPIMAYVAGYQKQRTVLLAFAAALVAYAIALTGLMAVNLPELVGGWVKYVFRDNSISGSTSSGNLTGVLHFLYSGIVFSGAGIWLSALAVVIRRPRGRLDWFAILWVGSALLGAVASGRFYADYFIPLIAPLILLVFVFASSERIASVRWVFVAVALLFCWRTAMASMRDTRGGTHEASATAAVARTINSAVGYGAVIAVEAYAPAIYLAADALPVNRVGVVNLTDYVHTDRLRNRKPVLVLASGNDSSPGVPANFIRLCRRQSISAWKLNLYGSPSIREAALCNRLKDSE
jgi:hypothetical protein